MPESVMREEAEFKLPKDLPLRARLKSVSVKTIPYRDKQTGEAKSFDKWIWEFTIEEEEYKPLRAWGETEDRLTNHPDNLVRQWGEVLSGTTYGIGDGIKTDDLLGLPCIVVLDQVVEEGKDNKKYYKTPVVNLFPASMWTDLTGQPDF